MKLGKVFLKLKGLYKKMKMVLLVVMETLKICFSHPSTIIIFLFTSFFTNNRWHYEPWQCTHILSWLGNIFIEFVDAWTTNIKCGCNKKTYTYNLYPKNTSDVNKLVRSFLSINLCNRKSEPNNSPHNVIYTCSTSVRLEASLHSIIMTTKRSSRHPQADTRKLQIKQKKTINRKK